jgi:hypothetical protein
VIPFNEEEETVDRNPSDSTTQLGVCVHMYVNTIDIQTQYIAGMM